MRENILHIVRQIPPGATMSYREVAYLAGNPKAARAVGAVMRANKDYSVPCHRVIAESGALGGYNGLRGDKGNLLVEERENIIDATICLVIKDGKVLLGMKKRGFGEGKWNGFGGKLEPGETAYQAMRRECREECCIDPTDGKLLGEMWFYFENEARIFHTYLYRASSFVGKPNETDEMSPRWYDLDQIPFDEMWSDDIHWMPIFLSDISFKGFFWFKGDKLIGNQIYTFE